MFKNFNIFIICILLVTGVFQGLGRTDATSTNSSIYDEAEGEEVSLRAVTPEQRCRDTLTPSVGDKCMTTKDCCPPGSLSGIMFHCIAGACQKCGLPSTVFCKPGSKFYAPCCPDKTKIFCQYLSNKADICLPDRCTLPSTDLAKPVPLDVKTGNYAGRSARCDFDREDSRDTGIEIKYDFECHGSTCVKCGVSDVECGKSGGMQCCKFAECKVVGAKGGNMKKCQRKCADQGYICGNETKDQTITCCPGLSCKQNTKNRFQCAPN